MRAWVELHPSLDVDTWRRKHAEGAVPDAVPYGLDRMRNYGIAIAVRGDTAASATALAHRLARRVAGGYVWEDALAVRMPRTADVALSWDERRGAPRALVDGRKRSVATGVIWLTDGRSSAFDRTALRALARCSLVWVLAEPQLALLEHRGIPRSRLAHLPFGIDADFFRSRPDVQQVEGLIVSAGNDRHRDWSTLLTAFELVRSVRKDARLELATRAPVPAVPGVTVHHALSHGELRLLYARAKVVAVSTTTNEHVSGMTVALESKAMQRPVVMTRTPGVDTYVADGTDGVLVPAADHRTLAEVLLGLLSDPAAVARMGTAGRASIDGGLSTEAQARRLAQLVNEHC